MSKFSSSLQFLRSSVSKQHREATSETYWVPNTDVYTSENGLVIKVELAGMRREDLELSVEDNIIKISGHRPDGCRPSRCSFLVMEINYGSFESVIELPKGYDASRARAVYQNGFLRIDVPAVQRDSQKADPYRITAD